MTKSIITAAVAMLFALAMGAAGSAWAAPAISGLDHTYGPLSGGLPVIVFGSGFDPTPANNVVHFGAVAGAVTSASATQLQVSVPASAAANTNTVDITVTVAGQTSPLVANDRFTYHAAPVITSISPSSGPSTGGTVVTLTGADLDMVGACHFGATACALFSGSNSTTATATAPPGTGTVDITLADFGFLAGTGSATSAADQFTYLASPAGPTVTGISPTSGPAAGGTLVTITGTNLSGVTGVAFGHTGAASVTGVSDTQVTAVSPSGSGAVDVVVTTSLGPSAPSAADVFTYSLPPPSVVSVLPASGSPDGGATVFINGAGFTGATAVHFGAALATGLVVQSDGQIQVTAPPGADSSSVEVTVTTPRGTSVTPTPPAFDGYTYVRPAPAVTSVSPSVATHAGQAVVIGGSNFTGATQVTFGALPAQSFTVVSATQINAVAPAGGSGTVHVVVTVNGRSSGQSSADQFTFFGPPALAGLDHTYGPLSGGLPVIVFGSGFDPAPANNVVHFGAVAGAVTSASATQLQVSVPASAAANTNTVDITVTVAGQTSPLVANDRFTYHAAPVISSISPSSGPSTGGTVVTLTGTDLDMVGACHFGAAACALFSGSNSTTATATAPPGTGAVDITLADFGFLAGVGSATSAADRFTYSTGSPTVADVNRTVAPGSAGDIITLAMTGPVTSITIVTPPAHGTVVVSGSDVFYTPDPGYSGPDSFTYTATNGSGTSSPATVSLVVVGPDPIPSLGEAALAALAALLMGAGLMLLRRLPRLPAS